MRSKRSRLVNQRARKEWHKSASPLHTSSDQMEEEDTDLQSQHSTTKMPRRSLFRPKSMNKRSSSPVFDYEGSAVSKPVDGRLLSPTSSVHSSEVTTVHSPGPSASYFRDTTADRSIAVDKLSTGTEEYAEEELYDPENFTENEYSPSKEKC
ncbi:hypothetical protein RvY_03068-2 [Ramazzottius varieornatus]|uniref:Uncharacterized protein n=1 Tax=Ramazzottius varieornatus TaxID=947166 RepID=A0A1D1UTV9_RAMVA|nr:hypothetical protein RvY_03068-2 [Ramazzottius varieornatus]